MEQEAPRQLPYDVDIEQALLGAILVTAYARELRMRREDRVDR